MRRWCEFLASEVSDWPEVASRPMFGLDAFYRRGKIFAALPRTRAVETPFSLMVKLGAGADDRLRDGGPGAGWALFTLERDEDVREALRRLERAYQQASGDRRLVRAPGSRLAFSDATQRDAEAITALHVEVAAHVTARFGSGHWSNPTIVRRIDPPSRHQRLRVGRVRGRIVTVLRLQTRKPWAIDVAWFTPVRRPVYLTGMVVKVKQQGQGFGRAALADARSIATAWPADAIRLDAYDGAAGAGSFYARCGYIERGHVKYKGNPLVYYELLIR